MKREVKIGIYAVVIMLCAWAGIRFLSGVDVFGRNATYYARYEQVNGVQNAAPVMIRGVKVGKVSEIRVSPENPTDVEVVISMSKAYCIPEDSEARIFSTSLMGSKAIEIALGKSDRMLENGATISSGYTKDLMSGDGSELDELKEKIVALVDNFNSALSGLSMLVDNNNRNITEAIDHLNSIMANLDNVMGSDSQQLADIVDGINSFTTTLRDNNARIDSIIMNVNDVTGELADRNVSASLAQAVEQLNRTLSQINSGEGSVGRLVYDKQLYDNLTEASDNLSALLADLKEHPKRYVHFSLFGSKDEAEKQAAKDARRAAREQRRSGSKADTVK